MALPLPFWKLFNHSIKITLKQAVLYNSIFFKFAFGMCFRDFSCNFITNRDNSGKIIMFCIVVFTV